MLAIIQTAHYRELRRIRKAVLERLREIEKPRGPAKYGLLNKGFRDEAEFLHFLSNVSSRQAKIIFKLERYNGLRIGEAVSLPTMSFNRQDRMLWVGNSEKGSFPALMPVIDTVYDDLCAWMDDGHAGKEFMFPSLHKANRRGHVSPHWAAKEFREAAKKAGLAMVYGHSLPCGLHKRSRPLYRLSTHSGRHRFIQDIHNKIGDLVITQKLARHRDIRSTLHYTYKSQEQIQEAMISVFR